MAGFNLLGIGATVLLALGAVGVMAVLSRQNRANFAFGQLAVMNGIYVGFAISALYGAGFARRQELSTLIVEALIALAFLFAGLGVLASSRIWLLGALILGHGVIDFAHLLTGESVSPRSYAFLCIIYDVIAGIGAIWLLSKPDEAK